MLPKLFKVIVDVPLLLFNVILHLYLLKKLVYYHLGYLVWIQVFYFLIFNSTSLTFLQRHTLDPQVVNLFMVVNPWQYA